MAKTRTPALLAVAATVLIAALPISRTDAAAGDGTPSDPNIEFVGRWDKTNAAAYARTGRGHTCGPGSPAER